MVHNMKTVLAVCLQYTQCVIDILYKLKLNLKEKKMYAGCINTAKLIPKR